MQFVVIQKVNSDVGDPLDKDLPSNWPKESTYVDTDTFAQATELFPQAHAILTVSEYKQFTKDLKAQYKDQVMARRQTIKTEFDAVLEENESLKLKQLWDSLQKNKDYTPNKALKVVKATGKGALEAAKWAGISGGIAAGVNEIIKYIG